jgi:hypothetical protein
MSLPHAQEAALPLPTCSAVVWSSALPSTDGFWWHRTSQSSAPKVVEIWTVGDGFGNTFTSVQTEYGTMNMMNTYRHWPRQEWAGPLLPPPNRQAEGPGSTTPTNTDHDQTH